MKPSQSVRALGDLKAEAVADSQISVDGPAHIAWQTKVQSVLAGSLGNDGEITTRFRDLSYYVGVWSGGPNAAAEDAEHFRGAVQRSLAIIDAAVFALGLEEGNDEVPSLLPRPEGREQEALVGVIWEWFHRRSAWPTYGQVLRAYDQRVDGDCMDPWRALPQGLVIRSPPPSIPSQSQPLSLTLAGAIACGFLGNQLTTFVAMVRLANQRWRAIDIDSDDDTVQVNSGDAQAAAVPDELSSTALALIGSLLASEPLGINSFSGLSGYWTITFREGIRHYRDINTIGDHWQRRTEMLADTHKAGSSWPTPSSASPSPDVSMFDGDLWEHVRHAVDAQQWAQVASQAIIFLEDTVRTRAGTPQAKGGGPLVGKDLIIKALASDGPLPLAQLANEIEGWRSLGQGLVAATGNVDRHHIQKRDDLRSYALGVLGTASLILTQIKHVHGPAPDSAQLEPT